MVACRELGWGLQVQLIGLGRPWGPSRRPSSRASAGHSRLARPDWGSQHPGVCPWKLPSVLPPRKVPASPILPEQQPRLPDAEAAFSGPRPDSAPGGRSSHRAPGSGDNARASPTSPHRLCAGLAEPGSLALLSRHPQRPGRRQGPRVHACLDGHPTGRRRERESQGDSGRPTRGPDVGVPGAPGTLPAPRPPGFSPAGNCTARHHRPHGEASRLPPGPAQEVPAVGLNSPRDSAHRGGVWVAHTLRHTVSALGNLGTGRGDSCRRQQGTRARGQDADSPFPTKRFLEGGRGPNAGSAQGTSDQSRSFPAVPLPRPRAPAWEPHRRPRCSAAGPHSTLEQPPQRPSNAVCGFLSPRVPGRDSHEAGALIHHAQPCAAVLRAVPGTRQVHGKMLNE